MVKLRKVLMFFQVSAAKQISPSGCYSKAVSEHARSPLPEMCNSHTKPMSRQFYRRFIFRLLLPTKMCISYDCLGQSTFGLKEKKQWRVEIVQFRAVIG